MRARRADAHHHTRRDARGVALQRSNGGMQTYSAERVGTIGAGAAPAPHHIAFVASCFAMNSSWVGITRVQLAITPRMLSMNATIFSSGYASTSAW